MKSGVYRLVMAGAAALALAAPLRAQALPKELNDLLNDPWARPALNFAIDRALQLSADQESFHAFFQANADDFSPGFFKTRLGPEWRAITEHGLDNRSWLPLRDRVELSFNVISIVPSAQVQVHALQEGRYWPQVSVAFSAWACPLELFSTNFRGIVSAWGLAPHLTLSKSLTKDAKAFLGYQYATGSSLIALSNLTQGLVPNLGAPRYQSHELFLGAVFLDRFNAEYAAWVDLNLTRQEVYLKAERTQGIFTIGLGLYPDHLAGILPMPYFRFRVRI